MGDDGIIKEVLLDYNDIIEKISDIVDKNYKNSHFVKPLKYDGSYSNLVENMPYIFYRGHSNYTWFLEPSINRNRTNHSRKEIKILKEVKEENFNLNYKDIIAMAQHNGKPTRAIDFTYDLKVALFFACYDLKEGKIDEENDGALYVCGYSPHCENFISSKIINWLAFYENDIMDKNQLSEYMMSNSEIKKYYEDKGNMIDNLLLDVNSYLKYGFMIVYDKEKIKHNEKLIKQSGSLFYCGSYFYVGNKKIKKNKRIKKINYASIESKYIIHPHNIVNPSWINSMCIKIKIPKEFKKEIYSQINVTKESLGL